MAFPSVPAAVQCDRRMLSGFFAGRKLYSYYIIFFL